MKQLKTFLLLSLVLIACQEEPSIQTVEAQLIEADRKQINIIPLPYHTELRGELFELTTPINWNIEGNADAVLKQAFNSTSEWIDALPLKSADQAWTISISAQNSAAAVPHLDMDESYTLEIKEYAIILDATTGIGIERGLQTLRQLIKKKGQQYTLQSQYIYDEPRYSWRGTMIDVSRHFIPIDILYQNIDALAAVKMNVLHLHLSDNQGFRMESKEYPKLHEIGSGGQYYTQAEMSELVQYAALRGIRIIPEFDMPGHASGWLSAYPEYGSSFDQYTIKETYGIYPDAMDPTKQDVYLFLATFIKEMTSIFPDRFMHIGSDEVIPTDWEQNERITQFMEDKGLKSFRDLQTYFNLRMADIVNRAGKKMIAWDEGIHPELAKTGTTIQAWRNKDAVYNAIKLNSPVISSNGWYLDHNLPMSELYQVEPTDAPDYMNIEIDPDQWSAYELSSDNAMLKQGGILFTFGDKDSSRGILNLMGQQHIIKSIDREEGIMSFTFKNASGPLTMNLLMSDNQLKGSLNLSFIGLPIVGQKVGGHDMTDGMVLPNFQKPEFPTAEQMSLIIGGESAIWTEWADRTNINAKIWPRNIAVAERLWSPTQHCSQGSDLYRRVQEQLPLLEEIGVIDDSHVLKSIARWTTDVEELRNLYELINLLEEVKYYNRWSSHPNHTALTTLNRLADLVPTESLEGYNFNTLVDDYLSTQSESDKASIAKKLNSWTDNYSGMKKLLIGHPELGSIEYHSLVLSDLSKMILALYLNQSISTKDLNYIDRVKKGMNQSRGGTTLSVLTGLIKLLDHELSLT